MPISQKALRALLGAIVLCLVAIPAYAGAIQLTSASQLNASDSVATYPGTNLTVLPSPVGLSVGGNVLTFTKLGAGAFVISLNGLFGSSFPPNTAVLYTGNAYGQGGGNIEIAFASPITELGFLVKNNFNFLAPPFSLAVYNNASLLGTFAVPGDMGTQFLGALAIGGDLITRAVISSPLPDFAIGPMTFGNSPTAVPEPATIALLGISLAGVSVKLRSKRKPSRQ